MRVTDTELHGVRRIEPEVFTDHRGSYVEILDTQKYHDATDGLAIVQDDISISHTRVLRVFHLAAQSHPKTSFAAPHETQTDILGNFLVFLVR